MTASSSVVVDRTDRAETRRRAEARELDARVAQLVERGWEDPPAEEELDDLAARLFQHQARHNSAAAAWWGALARAPGRVRGWRDVPPLPVAAFKHTRVAAFPAPPGGAEPTFLSSGTTSRSRSRVHVEDLALYEAALAAAFSATRCPIFRGCGCSSWRPSRRAGCRSSLLHMFGVLRERFGADGSVFLDRGDGLDGPALIDALERACAETEPVFLLGTAFAFVHALDALDPRGPPLRPAAGRPAVPDGRIQGPLA